MSLKVFNKNTLAVVLTLIIVILFSESRMLDFLINTYLGRTFFILILIVISFLNKMLGVVVVLLLIIAFNNSDIALFEGFSSNSSNNNDSRNNDSKSSNHSRNKNHSRNNDSRNSNHSRNSNRSRNSNHSRNNDSKKAKVVAAHEGFDLIGTENSIKRGKQSNSLPIDDNRGVREDLSAMISAYEGFENNVTFSSV